MGLSGLKDLWRWNVMKWHISPQATEAAAIASALNRSAIAAQPPLAIN
jgi:hypothetical protein